MWFETDVTDVLAAVRVPSAVLYKPGERGYGKEYAQLHVAAHPRLAV